MIGLMLLACGGAADDAPGADEETPVSEVPRLEPADPGAAGGDDGVLAMPVIPPDSVVQEVLLRGTLEHPDVKPYLHLEVADNVPLTVHAVPELADGAAELSTLGVVPVKPVEQEQARVRFTARVDLDGPRERIELAIPAEGVRGHVDFELADHVWSATSAELVEE